MYDAPSLKDKKIFLNHFLREYQMRRRESLWILNYILNHDVILNNIHFIEQAEFTPRGLVISTVDFDEATDAFVYYKNDKVYQNPEQAFHDIRLKWQETIYIELQFTDAYKVQRQFGILEENPYRPYDMTKTASKEEDSIVNQAQKIQLSQQVAYLQEEIDKALDTGDREAFMQYSQALNDLEKLMSEEV